MVEIVSRSQADDLLNRFRSTFGMHSMLLPLFGGQGLEQAEVRFADEAELIDRLARIALLIVAAGRPRVLIVSGDRTAGRTENQPDGERRPDLRGSQMRGELG